MEIKGFYLPNQDKVARAKESLHAQFGDNYSEEQLLAEYDKLGGLIVQDENKVEMGSFWDFENKQMREKPLVKKTEVKVAKPKKEKKAKK